jgi:hypothetical protein
MWNVSVAAGPETVWGCVDLQQYQISADEAAKAKQKAEEQVEAAREAGDTEAAEAAAAQLAVAERAADEADADYRKLATCSLASKAV